MSMWRHVNLSEVALWVCSDSRTLVCGVRLNAPRQQLRLSVRQRDDVHWKHIPFPVAPTSITSLWPLRPLLHTSVGTSILVNVAPRICRGPVLRHILNRFLSSVVIEFAGCARMLFIKLGGQMPKKKLDFLSGWWQLCHQLLSCFRSSFWPTEQSSNSVVVSLLVKYLDVLPGWQLLFASLCSSDWMRM